MPEAKDKSNSFEFKITDKRFSSKISEETPEKKEPEAEKEKVSEDAQGEEKKKSLKERLFGKKRTDSYSQVDTKSESVKKDTFPPPEIDFSSFIFSLSTQALIHIGEIPNPITQKKEKDLNLAKQTIDIIGMIKEKTTGNLTIHEEQLIDNLLYELRMKYIKEAN